MTMVRIRGEIDDLFSHMTLLGLGALVEESGFPSVRIWWDDDEQPVIGAGTELTDSDVASAVHAHVTRLASPTSWLRDRFSFSNGTKTLTVSTTAPRTASPERAEDWRLLEEARQDSIDSMSSHLERRLVAGLGYRSWWYRRGKDLRADIGANIWEMRTRNKGTEFIADRLLPLADVVSTWTVEEIRLGLLGETVADTHGKNSLESRTPTGFSTPRPVDNARAWCALWGLSMLPVAHLNDPSLAYPAYLPRRSIQADERHQLLMPVPNRPVSMARMRALLRSAHLTAAVEDKSDGSLLKRQTSWEWLRQQGVAALLRFPVRYVGSASAPERQALTGIRVWP